MHSRKAQLFLFIVCFISSLGKVSAQDSYLNDDRKFYGGLVAGGNFTQVDGDNFAGYHKAGLNVGGIVYLKMDEHLATSIEVLYSQKGAKSKDYFVISPGYVISDYGITLNYAEVPIMINYFDRRGSHFGGGFSYGRLGTAQEHITTQPASTIDLTQYPFKKSDYNILLSGSLHCWKGLFLNVRFQYSVLSIRDNTPQNYSRGQQFNNIYAVRLMYLFGG